MTTFTEVLYYIQNEQLSNDDLNRVIDAVKWSRARNARKAAVSLQIGSQVRFDSRRQGLVVGVLKNIKIKNATVEVNGVRWNVPLAMLEAA
jgi:hypothetical protein